ncbi:hypothetical protein PRIPAC_84828 [Pristionchus pacificus]|uniref:Uncharacterized protein n=1 Tax=Pristionchus pacificus TaxID=54126 RepID=A0A2A6BSH3_PRIPA|nr:hypothetical protein PRIPAC_84828 [Pristionchus pacificus]|eukprot:PDM68889.1 hypothetical protein PRIPAC_47191 [Pristionchus pacificus]
MEYGTCRCSADRQLSYRILPPPHRSNAMAEVISPPPHSFNANHKRVSFGENPVKTFLYEKEDDSTPILSRQPYTEPNINLARVPFHLSNDPSFLLNAHHKSADT